MGEKKRGQIKLKILRLYNWLGMELLSKDLTFLSSIGCNVLLFVMFDRVLIWCNCFNRMIEDSSC